MSGRTGTQGRTELSGAVHIERHNSVEPVPEDLKDATALDQF